MPTPPRPGPDRARLAAKLREIRAATGMSGNRFAQHLGWPQSRVSKLETGVQFPTGADIEAWLEAAGVEEDSTLTELLTRARLESVAYRQSHRELGGAAAQQRSWHEQEQQATRIATFHLAITPGLLQTPDYARDIMSVPTGPAEVSDASPEEIERAVAARVERQALLHDTGRSLPFVLGEAALRMRVGSLANHLGQLDRLQSLAGLRTVDLRIVPMDTVLPFAPAHGFEIHDDRLVLVETLTRADVVMDPDEIGTYQRTFERLQAAAVADDDAVRLIQHVARQLTDET